MGLALGLVLGGMALVGCREGTPSSANHTPSRVGPRRVAPPPVGRLRLVTWNVLADPVFRTLRVPAVLEVLERTGAHVIALQEVAPWFLEALTRQPWVRRQYRATSQGGRWIAPGGQLVLVRRPLRLEATRWAVLPGRQRRTVLEAHLRVNGRSLVISTSHLESFLADGPMRARQLRVMFSRLETAQDAVVLGDLNFGDGEQPETRRLDRRYRDVWRALHPARPGFTWDMARNPLAKVGAFKTERSRRLDRVLVRSSRWAPAAVRVLGNRAVGRAVWQGHPPAHAALLGDGTLRAGQTIDVFPSDHYGLLADLRWRPSPR